MLNDLKTEKETSTFKRQFRTEKDFLGEKEVRDTNYYGIHSLRAKENFPNSECFLEEWYKAMGEVKWACYQTYISFSRKCSIQYPQHHIIPEKKMQALIRAAQEISKGNHFQHFIVPAICGGAGTSINMNVNEIIANRALDFFGYSKGDYEVIDPIEEANVFQSTNDVVPTALKIASLKLLKELEKEINLLRMPIENYEKAHRGSLRDAYTEMQKAVPSSYGLLFSTYAEALSRDWWRVSKCVERLKTVNLGGGAVGTGLGSPRFFILNVVNELKEITGLPLCRSENMSDTTANMDVFTECHGILRSYAVNLNKMVQDLRLLSSPLGGKKIRFPSRQVGSSIMPGKINPVVPEYVISEAHRVFSNDSLIQSLCSEGCLDLNAYIPTIGDAFLKSIKILISCSKTLRENLFSNLEILDDGSSVWKNSSILTAMIPLIGYHKLETLSTLMKEKDISIFDANEKLKVIPNRLIEKVLKPEELLSLGFTLKTLYEKT